MPVSGGRVAVAVGGLTGLHLQAIPAFMKRVPITELKNRLSYYLRLVKRGETVELIERNVPVARLSRIGASAAGSDDLVRRLEREGIVTVPTGKPYTRLLDKPPLPCSGDAVRALIEERGDR